MPVPVARQGVVRVIRMRAPILLLALPLCGQTVQDAHAQDARAHELPGVVVPSGMNCRTTAPKGHGTYSPKGTRW